MTTTIEMVEWLDKCASYAQIYSVTIAETYNQIAQRLREIDKSDCVWKDRDGEHHTACGKVTPYRTGGKFCRYCGGLAVKEST